MRMDDVEYNTSSSNAPWNTQFHFIPIIPYKFSENYGEAGEGRSEWTAATTSAKNP